MAACRHAALGAALPSGGLVLAGATGIVAGFITLVGAFAMPARTRSGALLRALLKAYRRTLQLTMAQSRSMLEVVQRATLPWLETPDQALVWSTALGLQRDAQKVLERSVEDVREARPTAGAAWFPAWYGAGGGWSGGAGTIGIAPGLMAASAIPNVSSMFGAIGAIGSPSGGGAGGGFGGGGGGGGGGAGGGF